MGQSPNIVLTLFIRYRSIRDTFFHQSVITDFGSNRPWILLCDSITKILIPDGCTSIGSCAFAGFIGLNSVSIPNSVTKIGAGAFSGCRKLFDVYCYAPEPPVAETSSFENYNVYLHVPCNCLRDYQMDVVFGSFKYIVCNDIGTDIEELHKSQEDTPNGKFLQNGYLYILRDGKTYNAEGTVVE